MSSPYTDLLLAIAGSAGLLRTRDIYSVGAPRLRTWLPRGARHDSRHGVGPNLKPVVALKRMVMEQSRKVVAAMQTNVAKWRVKCFWQSSPREYAARRAEAYVEKGGACPGGCLASVDFKF